MEEMFTLNQLVFLGGRYDRISGLHSDTNFVAIFSVKTRSCSTNRTVGWQDSRSASICILEMTSTKLSGSSQTSRLDSSQRLLAIRTFFFCPPLNSAMSFSNWTRSKSSLRKMALKRLSSIPPSRARSDRLPRKNDVSWET